MLFVAMAKVTKPGSLQERTVYRAQWQHPEGYRVVGEYWPVGGGYAVITIFEADDVGPVMASLAAWDEFFEWTVTPILTAEEGLRLAEMM
jgi:muconolactone delta-isomerase